MVVVDVVEPEDGEGSGTRNICGSQMELLFKWEIYLSFIIAVNYYYYFLATFYLLVRSTRRGPSCHTPGRIKLSSCGSSSSSFNQRGGAFVDTMIHSGLL